MSTDQDTGEIRKRIEATIDSFLLAYEDGREANDPSIINRAVTSDCTRQLLPASLCTALGAPPELLMPNDMYEKLFADDLALGGVYNTATRHLVIDVEARRAAVSTTEEFKYHDGDVIALEFAFTFYFNEDGTKISRVIEVADSNAVLKMAAKARAHAESSASETPGKGAGVNDDDATDFSESG
ncbi:hypothetical protein ACHAP5_004239 [Fusarium lateritium]